MSETSLLNLVRLFVGGKASTGVLTSTLQEEFQFLESNEINPIVQDCRGKAQIPEDFAIFLFLKLSLKLRQVILARNERFLFESEEYQRQADELKRRLQSKDDDLRALERLVEA
jgi:hypothetical protein